ncbi:MAG: putative lipid II flippase FtsW [Firmicutes bacterium]|nr:putative lipid II flippase FtsW [Bacillota bacterium]
MEETAERLKKGGLKNNKLIQTTGKTDRVLTAVTLVMVAFGVLMVYSASSYNAEVNYGNRFHFMYKQFLGVIFGLCAMFALAIIDYRRLAKLRYVILGAGFALLLLVFIPGVGVENYGARRWINLPFFTLQASEIAKFAFIIFAAAYMAKNYRRMSTFRGLLPVLLVGSLMCVLIILEPNMSITMCVGLLMFVMMFIGGARIKHFVLLLIPFAALIPVLILLEPYRLSRLMAFLDPWAAPLGEGYQLIQSYYSLGSGGLFGLGLFNSRQKYLFLPFSESDFILSIIGEELGLFGCLALFCGYVLMIARAVRIAQRASDRFGCYLASGVGAIIAIQTLVNIAVVTGSIPPTGLPLPFISSGSSSLIVFMGSVGILQSIARASHKSVEAVARKERYGGRKGNRRIRDKE